MELPDSDSENADQIAYWNGVAGDRWTSHQSRQDIVLAPVSERLIARAGTQPNDRVIDVGCGTGAITLALAAMVGGAGHVLGIDISKPMLERARQRVAGDLPVSFVLADATTYPFAPEKADLVVSRFGVMFFAEPARSFANIRKAMRRGGRLVFACWREPKQNPWMLVPLRAAYRHVPKLPQLGPDDPGPFSFASPDRVRAILDAAGFADVVIEPHDFELDVAAGEGIETAVEAAASIGPAHRAMEGQDDKTRAAALASIREALLQYARGASVRLGAAIWIVTARAP